jgi:hypothetical protein
MGEKKMGETYTGRLSEFWPSVMEGGDRTALSKWEFRVQTMTVTMMLITYLLFTIL